MNKSRLPPSSDEQPEELSLEYFSNHPRTYSARILNNLASNPFFTGTLRGKKPTDKQLLLIASVIISTLDARIDDAQREASRWRAVLDGPLFQRSLPAPNPQVPDPPEGLEQTLERAEQRWFQRYLTLRNILGASVTFLTMLGAVLVFLTANYKGRAEDAEGKVQRIQGDVAYWRQQSDGYKKDAEEKLKELTEARSTATHQLDQASKEKKELSDLSNRLSKQATEAQKLLDECRNPKK